MTTDDVWRPTSAYLEEKKHLNTQGITLSANGALGINDTGEVVIVTCAHVFDDTQGTERLSYDGICFTIPGAEQDRDIALPISNWDPKKPVRIRSFIPEEDYLIELEVWPKKVSLFDEIAGIIATRIRNGTPDYIVQGAYSEVPKSKTGESLFRPGVSGSPLIQEGKIVGVVSWIIHETDGTYKTQIVGYSMFGQEPRSRILIYSIILLIPAVIVLVLRLIVGFIRCQKRKFA